MTRSPAFVLYAVLLCLIACPAGAARPALTWERMHTAAQPSRLLMRLGLTHITRLGFTRDGAQKSIPDGQFPPGLTDVVPVDAEHIVQVRGTAAGRAAFRRRVVQMDAQMRGSRWHVAAFLVAPPVLQTEANPSPSLPEAGRVKDSLTPPELGVGGPPATVQDILDAPATLTVSDGAGTRTYQVDVNDVPGSVDVLVTMRPNLAVSALPIAGLILPAPPAVWGTPLTVRVRPGTEAVFADNVAARAAARARLKLPVPAAPEPDVVLHVTVSPFVAVTPAPVMPSVLPPAAP